MAMILRDGTQWTPAIGGTIQIQTGNAADPAYFQVNDANLADNTGSYQGHARICKTGVSALDIFSTTTPNIVNPAILDKTHINVGDTFHMTLTAQSPVPPHNPYDGEWKTTGVAGTFKIVSVATFAAGTGWQWFDPDTFFSGAPTVGTISPSCDGWAGNSTTAGVIGFQLMSIP